MNWDWGSVFVGFIGGWVVEWLIDVFYFRPNRSESTVVQPASGTASASVAQGIAEPVKAKPRSTAESEELASLRSRVAELTKIAAKVPGLESQIAASSKDLESRSSSLKAAEIELARLRGELGKRALSSAKEPLEKITGIGKVFESKLWDAGIHTFAQLAETPVETIRGIIKPENWQAIDPDLWIREAKEFAAGAKK